MLGGEEFEASYGLTLISFNDVVMTKNLFKLPKESSSVSNAEFTKLDKGREKHLCLLLGLPEDSTEADLVIFLEPYANEVQNYALYQQYQYLELSTKYGKFKPLMSAVVELKSKDSKESFVGVYNNLIAPSVAGDGAVPLLALSLAWVVMFDDELFLKERHLQGFESVEARNSTALVEANTIPIALPTCGTCLSRVKGEVSGIFDSEIDSSLVSLKMSQSRRRCRTCLVGYEYLRLHQTPTPTSSIPGLRAMPDNNNTNSSRASNTPPIWRCCGSLDTTGTVLSRSACDLNENIWVCLLCSYTGCGRYSNQHAKEHYNSTGHSLTVELVTGRVWSYKQDTFVHVDGSLSNVYSGYAYMQESDESDNDASTEEADGNRNGKEDGSQVRQRRAKFITSPRHLHRGGRGLGITKRGVVVRDTVSPLVTPSSSADTYDDRFDRDYALAAAGAAYEGNDGGLESRNFFYNYHPDYQQRGSGNNSGGSTGSGSGDSSPHLSLSNPGDVVKAESGYFGDKLSPGKATKSSYFLAPNPMFARDSPLAAGGGPPPYNTWAAGGGSVDHEGYFHPLPPPGYPPLHSASSTSSLLDNRTREKLDNVKAEYDMLKDSRLVEQDILLEKMLAQEMARALHDRFSSGSGNAQSRRREMDKDTRKGDDRLRGDKEEDEERLPYPTLEAAHHELRNLRPAARDREGSDSESSISSRAEGDAGESTTNTMKKESSGENAARIQAADYLNKQTESDLQAIEACKIDISLLDQESLSLQDAREEALRSATVLKATNNRIIANIKGLKEQQEENGQKQAHLWQVHKESLQETRQTIADLRFYLRSRDTLANIPTDRMSQREVQSGTVTVVQSPPPPQDRQDRGRGGRRGKK